MAGKPNPQNLIPIRTHERAVELGRKGGLKTSAKKQWTNLKYCSEKCPYSGMCPFMVSSSASFDKFCALKAQKVTMAGKSVSIQPDLIQSFFSLFEDGKEGLLKEALASVYKIRLRSANSTTEDLHKYVHTLIDLKKAFFPEKEDAWDTNININIKEPEWISSAEAERRVKELKKKSEAIETTGIVIHDIPTGI